MPKQAIMGEVPREPMHGCTALVSTQFVLNKAKRHLARVPSRCPTGHCFGCGPASRIPFEYILGVYDIQKKGR